MKKKDKLQHIRVLVTAVFSVGLYVIVLSVAEQKVEHASSAMMDRAVQRAVLCFDLIRSEKILKKLIKPDDDERLKHPMLGEESSEITTTLGSYDAKITSANSEFAALTVRLLTDAGIDSTQKVGLTLSGSFPGLAVSILCALEEMKVEPVMISSLGASSFGANQIEMTWADMENCLTNNNRISYGSRYVTLGGESDTGGGISEEGIDALKRSVQRNHRQLIISTSLENAIAFRESLFRREDISLLINIGGNHAILGGCIQGISIQNGLQTQLPSCSHSDRGLLLRVSKNGMPIVHFLNIQDLARQFGIEENGVNRTKSAAIYYVKMINHSIVGVAILLIISLFVLMNRLKNDDF